MHSIKHKIFIIANKDDHDAMLNMIITFGQLQFLSAKNSYMYKKNKNYIIFASPEASDDSGEL